MPQPNQYSYSYGGYYRAPQPPQRKRGRGCLVVLVLMVVALLVAAVVALTVARPALEEAGVFDRISGFLPDGDQGDGSLSGQDHELLDRWLQSGYVYSQLDSAEQEQYRIMFDAFASRQARKYPYVDSDNLTLIRNYVLADHPELFYVAGVNAQITTTRLPWGEGSVAMIEGIYRYDEAESERLQQLLEESAASCLAGIPDDADDYAKAKYLYEYLAENVEYDWSSIDSPGDNGESAGQTAVDALVNKSALCAGYANAYGYLAQKLGLQCVYVTGDARGDAHAWNAVRLDGEYYYVDPTWGDPQFVESGGEASDFERVNYDYLCITTADLERDHAIGADEIVPECTATADNYYVREGTLLDSPDVAQAGSIIQKALDNGQPSAQMRCTTYEVYALLKNLLFDQGEVYVYLQSSSCWYSTNDTLYSITVIF